MYKTPFVWISLIWFSVIVCNSLMGSLLSWAGVKWITYTGYLFSTVGLTLTRHLKDMLSLQKVWVPFLVLLFLFFHFFILLNSGSYLRSGHYKLSAGRHLLVISRDNTNKWANDFSPAMFLWRYIFFPNISSTKGPAKDYSWIIQIKEVCRKVRLDSSNHDLEITYLPTSRLWITLAFPKRGTITKIWIYLTQSGSCTCELRFSLPPDRLGQHWDSPAY